MPCVAAYRIKQLPQCMDLPLDGLWGWWPSIRACLIQTIEAWGCRELAESFRLCRLGGIHGCCVGDNSYMVCLVCVCERQQQQLEL